MSPIQDRSSSASRRASRRTALLLAGALAGLGASACNPGGASAVAGTSAGPVGATVAHPDPAIRSSSFVVEENKSGRSSGIKIQAVFWGRLVDVVDSNGELQNVDYVIGEDIRTGPDYLLETNAVTEKTTLTILHPAGTTAYQDAFDRLDLNLTPIQDKSLSPSELPPFSVAPRNSAMVVIFDDLLDPRFDGGGWRDSFDGNLVAFDTGQISPQAVQVRTDYPPSKPYEARVVLDPNHGDLADFDGDGEAEFHSTRLIVDTTVSLIESDVSNPPLPVNSLGLPAAITTSEPNIALRFPTRIMPSVGQTVRLSNPTKHGLAFLSNGSRDDASLTDDVVRALRSGGDTEVTQDLNNGFLTDLEPPKIIGNISVDLMSAGGLDPRPDPDVDQGWIIPLMGYSVAVCDVTPKPGDVLIQNATQAIVTGHTPISGQVTQLKVQVVTPASGGTFNLGAAQLLSPYDPVLDVGREKCFVRFSPEPGIPPATAVSKGSLMLVRFSEPMDPFSVRPFDSFTVARTGSAPTAFDLVVGKVVPSSDLREFAFTPVLDLDHTEGTVEDYFLTLLGGDDGPTDLAGNDLAAALPQVRFQLTGTEASSRTAGVAMRFAGVDELFDDTYPEWRSGQLLYNPARQIILPRPVNRFSVPADRSQPLASVMGVFVGGVQTPLSPLGSKLQKVYRYVDLGFSIDDETNINIDVEGLAWAPSGGAVVSDAYDEFSIRLSHSIRLPDEFLDPGSGFPKYPNSGLLQTYAQNTLDTQTIMHPRDRGYVVTPADLFTASSGTIMMPYPLNRGIPKEDFRYFVWRDTRVPGTGGAASGGATLEQEANILGVPGPGVPYGPGQVPTVGLPLLVEIRCYPDDDALGLNPFEIALAVNSSARPNFRAFSTGGFNTSNQPVVKDPDGQDTATGGFSPGTTPPGGVTGGLDNSYYLGHMDLVTRTSIVHSIWFDTGYVSPNYSAPVVEPSPEDQPVGTSITFAYRGATALGLPGGTAPNGTIASNAGVIDYYGNPNDPAGNNVGNPSFLNGDNTWKTNLSALNGARYFQVRLTFVGNAASNKTAELTSLGFAYQQ